MEKKTGKPDIGFIVFKFDSDNRGLAADVVVFNEGKVSK